MKSTAKISLLAYLLMITFTSFGQEQRQTSQLPTPFELRLVDSTEASKNDLYIRAMEWVAKTYTSAKTVVQMQDKDAGKIIGKAKMLVPMPSFLGDVTYDGIIDYTFTIDLKDNKYRIVLSDFYHTGYSGYTQSGLGSLDVDAHKGSGWSVMSNKKWNGVRLKVYERSQSLTAIFDSAMKGATADKKDDGF